MYEKSAGRSGWQMAAELAKLAKAIYRVVRAALIAGWEGAVVAAVKEAIPYLVKIVSAVLVLLLLPMMAFTAVPNTYFGFGSSETASIQDMTAKAAALGSTYMSLGEIERVQIDAIVR